MDEEKASVKLPFSTLLEALESKSGDDLMQISVTVNVRRDNAPYTRVRLDQVKAELEMF